ncbi:MAG: Gfo/Idh/MocA family oxidoreductase [Anaerolineae bacterium]|nr:Gfo/Idh/MocA family oxidoreductase [Anaerolineae bacterium]
MIRVGLIGAGFVGPAHVEALRRLGYVEVLALAEANARRAREKADQMGIPEACGDYRKLLANPRVTVVHNATPNWMHFEINRQALLAGKHVVSEKPLALTAEEARALVEDARGTELVNAVNYNYRGYPLLRQMRAMIARGDIGQVRLVHGSYLQDWMTYPTDYSWRVLTEQGGASRALADIGSHWCDLAQWVTGQRISRVMGRLATVVPIRFRPVGGEVEAFAAAQGPREAVEVRTEDCASVLIDLDGGATGSFVVSQVSPGRKNRLWIEIDGSEGALAWDQDYPDELWHGHRGRPNQVMPRDPALLDVESLVGSFLPAGHPEGWSDALRNLFAEIYGFIRAGKSPVRDAPTYPTFYDGLVENVLVEAILESYRLQQWVDVPQVATPEPRLAAAAERR